ncbi:hypothetical protein ANCCEY_13338 [Ancylostoma ceylanicum]|uniref:G-protein coupled receptors family 1 profile domain-containing protein n=1 Tax=Ancylostoma ceylanicum TaxID=53326 RepID=A0A0D6L767_9BILA|nr:hypothetical protein ANCCEY_13338 [Ancylostoma ceylanicum]
MGVVEFLKVASTIVFVLAAALNAVLIYIVSTKTRNKIGVYKYMIICFAVCNIVYSATEYTAKPEVVAQKTTVYWKPTMGLFAIVVMMLFTLVIMILRKVAMSAKTISIQHQLLRALITQAIIPFLMSYIPRFLMFFFVIMGYPPLRIYTFVPLVVASYTVLDPIATIYFIHEYRAAVMKIVGRLILMRHRRNISDAITEPHNHTMDTHPTTGH